jgi:allantoinase
MILVLRQAGIPVMGRHPVDIVINHGQIESIQKQYAGPSDEELDASGNLVLPGFVDAHVHFNEPGRTDWEGLETGSKALAAGGVTTFFDMPLNISPPVLSAKDLLRKARIAQKKSCVDFALWGGLVPGNHTEIAGMKKAGAIGIKAFLCDSGLAEFPHVDRAALRRGAIACKKAGMILAVHAEDPEELQKASVPGTDWKSFVASRPEACEVAAIRSALEVAGETGCRLHIVHVSSPEGLILIHSAGSRGLDVTCETCPHYLLMDESAMERVGALAKCAPPLRSPKTVSALWKALKSGRIQTIGSDHSPCPPDKKLNMPFHMAWGGISGCQHAMPLFVQAARARRIPWDHITELTSARAARRFGLFRKGLLMPGADADLVILQKSNPIPIKKSGLFTRHAASPYVGMPIEWKVAATIVRGNLVYHQNKHSDSFRGNFLQPDI